MLSPEYLDSCAKILLGMVDEVNKAVVEDIARRIVKMNFLTETAEFQAQLLQENDMLFDDIIKDIASMSGETQAEIKNIFEEAAFENLETENVRAQHAGKPRVEGNERINSLMKAHMVKTAGDVKNLTMTTATQGQLLFFNACNSAHLQVSSGVFTSVEAIKKAIKEVAKSGAYIQYPTGHREKIDVAVRRAVLTGVNQSAAKMNIFYCEEIGTDLVEVTAHSGARPEHAVWQGGIYSLSGKSKGYESLEAATGYGTGAGLCGWNCRHSFYAYYEGSPRAYSKKYLDNLDGETYEYGGTKYTNYEASQVQRAFEREIRGYKREIAGLNAAYKEADDTIKAALKDELEWPSVKLKRAEIEMKRFCNATKRRIGNARTQVYAVRDTSDKIVGFDKSAAQRARQLAIKHHIDWLKSIGAEESELKNLEKYYISKYNKTKEYQDLMLLNKDKKLLDKIKNDYDLTIHEGKQGKHIIGHNNYNGKSYLLDTIDPQELVNEYAGTGEVKRDRHGNWTKKQFFVHDSSIGMVKNEDGVFVETKRFSISYSKNGAHIVPRLEI